MKALKRRSTHGRSKRRNALRTKVHKKLLRQLKHEKKHVEKIKVPNSIYYDKSDFQTIKEETKMRNENYDAKKHEICHVENFIEKLDLVFYVINSSFPLHSFDGSIIGKLIKKILDQTLDFSIKFLDQNCRSNCRPFKT